MNISPKPKKRKEDYLNHPQFMERFGAAMMGVETPKEVIPDWMRYALNRCLMDMPFPSIGVPMHVYSELCFTKCEEMTFGVLQKAADIIFSSNPKAKAYEFLGEEKAYAHDYCQDHYELVRSMATLLDAMKAITDPIRDKVIEELIAADSIIK